MTYATQGTSRPVVAFLPPACCGAGYFRPLRRALGDQVEFLAAELPGRGRRYREPAITQAGAAVADITARLDSRLDAIYGESLGAYLGLAVAAALRQSRPPLLIAASNSPPSARERTAASQVLTIDDAIAAMRALGGEIPAEIADHPELADQAFGVIRDDLFLSQSLIASARGARTAGDIQVIGGAGDAGLVQLESWASHAEGSCRVSLIPGGHLLSRDNPPAVAKAILAALAGR